MNECLTNAASFEQLQHYQEQEQQHQNHLENEGITTTSSQQQNNISNVVSTTKYIDSLLDDCYNKTPTVTSTSASSANYYKNLFHMHRMKYYLIYISLGIANSSDASEILCLSYILSNPDFQNDILDNDMVRHGSYAAGSVFFGMLIGGLVVGSLGDGVYFGRKTVLLIGLIINALFGIIASFSNHIYIFLICRWMAGVGIGGSIPPLFTLAAELAPTSKRGLYITVVASFWMVGSIFISYVALMMFEYWGCSWRLFMCVAAFPALLGSIMVYLFVPESPKFYLSVHKYDCAVQSTKVLLVSMNSNLYPSTHMISDRELQIIQQQHQQLYHKVNAKPHYGNILRQSMNNVIRLFHLPSLHTSTIALQIIWLCLSFGTYGLLTWINTIFVSIHLQNVYFNSFLFAMANLPGNILSACLLDRIGRHNLLLFSMVLASFSLIIFAYQVNQQSETALSTTSSIIIVASACSFQALSITAWNTIDCMTTEMFPTSLRSTGLAVCTATGRIGAMLAQFINGIMIQNNQNSLLLILSSLMLLLGAIIPKILLNKHYDKQQNGGGDGSSSSSTTEGDMSGKALLEDEDILSIQQQNQQHYSGGCHNMVETSNLVSNNTI